jgi:hypothetical protein
MLKKLIAVLATALFCTGLLPELHSVLLSTVWRWVLLHRDKHSRHTAVDLNRSDQTERKEVARAK